jgi:D-alanyl-D-alanine carboxypeptidase/D-alanyl-D-alanine-endopeptidase (penicillin-binding protein 4)
VHPRGRSNAVGISGTIAADARAVTRTVAVDNPTTYFAAAVRAGLEANGIRVPGPGGAADDLTGYTPPAPRREVLVHHSAPLAVLADTLMKLSQNMYAETLLRTVSRTDSTPGTADAGRTVVRDTLSGWGVPASEMLIVDGSGLSRYNLTTADAMASVLAHVYAEPRLRDPYVASLPIAGRAGTLAARMKGTAAEGNAHAKTGSFTNARGIAGFVQSADGEPLAFAILANNYGVPGEVVDRVSDAIVVALAEFSRGT